MELNQDGSVRILFSSVGAIGHLYPMVPLAEALASAGHEIRWASSPDVCLVIEQAGFKAVPAGMTMSTRKDHRDQRMAELAALAPDERTDSLVAWMFGELLASAMLDDLVPVVREWQPAMLVHDALEFAAPIAAAAVGAAHVAHSLGPLTPEHRVVSIADNTARLWKSAGAQPRPYGGLYDYLYLDIYPPSLQPPGGDHVRRRQLLRPTPYPPASGKSLPPSLAGNPQCPLVYVTFGTEIPDDRPLRVIIEALVDQPLRLLVTVGTHRDPEVFGPQPPHVAIERFVPQAAVLPHAAAVVSHGGSGTVLAALAAGLPQLCLPYLADQPINARAVSDAGAGLALAVATLEHKQVVNAVASLLGDTRFANRARTVANEIAGLPDAPAVASSLVALQADH